MSEGVRLADLVTTIKIDNIDETLEKLEKIKSLMCEINDLFEKLFK